MLSIKKLIKLVAILKRTSLRTTYVHTVSVISCCIHVEILEVLSSSSSMLMVTKTCTTTSVVNTTASAVSTTVREHLQTEFSTLTSL